LNLVTMPNSSNELADTTPSFEAALAELQGIVADLEDGSIGLEQSLTRYARGVSLLKTCYQVLEQAEQRIEILVNLKADGTPVTQPFDASATADAEAPAAGKRRVRKAAQPSASNVSERPDDVDESRLF
jgi:exodeoxyribonuclease VII small subunit